MSLPPAKKTMVLTVAKQGVPGSGLNPLIQGYRERLVEHGAVSGAVEISFRAANQHALALTGAVALSLADWPSQPGEVGRVTLWIAQDSSAHVVTWPPEVDWGANGEPVLSVNREACITLISRDGGATVRGFLAGAGFQP